MRIKSDYPQSVPFLSFGLANEISWKKILQVREKKLD